MTQDAWDPVHLPDAAGKTFVVTGGHAGIGYFISEQLACAGARVVMASRDEHKVDLAREAIRARTPHADVRYHHLDLSQLSDARDAGHRLEDLGPINGLILNAAALTVKERRTTPDGHELVFGTNYFGNVQFVAAALSTLASTSGVRIVTMGSFSQNFGRLDLDDLDGEKRPYKGFRTYATSKLAQMLFAMELDRRLRRTHRDVKSLIAHPGGALDSLTPDRPPAFTYSKQDRRKQFLLRLFSQSKENAAWPAVRAALDLTAEGGQVWGPGSMRGPPTASVGSPSWRLHRRSSRRKVVEDYAG